MYLSNQQRQKRYAHERVEEEVNDKADQRKLYTQLAKEAATDEQANQLVELASRIGTAIIEPKEPTKLSKLLTAIADNKLSQFVKKIEETPSKGLTGASKIIQSVIKSADFKEETNKRLADLVQQGKNSPQLIANALAAEVKKNPLFQKRAAEAGIDLSEEEVLDEIDNIDTSSFNSAQYKELISGNTFTRLNKKVLNKTYKELYDVFAPNAKKEQLDQIDNIVKQSKYHNKTVSPNNTSFDTLTNDGKRQMISVVYNLLYPNDKVPVYTPKPKSTSRVAMKSDEILI